LLNLICINREQCVFVGSYQARQDAGRSKQLRGLAAATLSVDI